MTQRKVVRRNPKLLQDMCERLTSREIKRKIYQNEPIPSLIRPPEGTVFYSGADPPWDD